jgi:HD-GYP domain-containing protein (c-di-GMP phosphodiesterase class II)/ABC-type amino acid transport substrate-binding protein
MQSTNNSVEISHCGMLALITTQGIAVAFQLKHTGFRFSIRLTVVGVFAIATTLTAIIAISLQFYFSRTMAIDAALSKYQHTANNTSQYLSTIDSNAIQITRILAKHTQLTQEDSAENWVNSHTLPLFSEVMKNNRIFYAIYLGFPNGDFYEVVNLNSSTTARRQLQATPNDRWMVITVRGQGDERVRRFEYYDDNFNLRTSRVEKNDYDPRIRPWFINAHANSVYKTDPYLFQHLQAPGQSYSMKLPSTDVVLAVDITLSSLSGFLKAQALGHQSEIYLYQHDGELIASNQIRSSRLPLPYIPKLTLTQQQQDYVNSIGKIRVSNELNWTPIDYAISGEPQGYTVDLMRMIAMATGLNIEFVNGYSWKELLGLFESKELDILQPVFKSTINQHLGRFSKPILTLPYAVVTQSDVPDITNLDQLRGKTLAIPTGWSVIEVLRQQFPDIAILTVDSPKAALQAVKQGQAYATLDGAIILHYTADYYFIEGIKFHENIHAGTLKLPEELHFLVQNDSPLLIEILNKAINHIDQSHIQQLEHKWFNHQAPSYARQQKNTVPYAELITQAARSNNQNNQLKRITLDGTAQFVYVTALNQGAGAEEYFAVVTPEHTILAPSMQRVKISILITSVCLIVLLPVIWLFAAPIVGPIKRLALENERIKRRRYDEVTLHDSTIVEIYDLSKSIVDMASTIQQHEEAQKALMESLIQLIAQAIDDKSPYTAGHCARVPELAIMLADAASRSQHKPFDQFRFHNDDEYQEFRLAAWLHDCGKITTPEHIVDKGTKLETIYNRIHEIRTRFEVLWRDAEIDYLKKVLQQPQQQEFLGNALKRKQRQLQEDFEFIANTNIGGESMSEQQLQRLSELAMITWQRHFDDRLGISSIEAMRYPDTDQTLPVTETLLADKPQHIIEHTRSKQHNARFGINMHVPEHLYNLGERYNLSVSRGTLTKEDRFKIQEHMISTIKMLEGLPFPDELAKVPRYASTHHETLKGTGYPRGLPDAELSIPERIIAVADIFEALTASDRPYKQAKKLSESITILYNMVEAGNIDRDVFELFLRSGVYLEYAKRFLQPEQIDAVSISDFLR